MFFNHSNLHSPSSETEMVDLVRWAAHEGRKMSVVGSGHSWSAIANCQDILVSLCNYKGKRMCRNLTVIIRQTWIEEVMCALYLRKI